MKIGGISMKLKSNATRIQKQSFEDDESESSRRYPNLAYFQEKYCNDCDKNCEFPSMETFGCMLKRLSNKKDKEGEKK